jgi:2-methylisocitrate lyase-like PEP mutase family enzyme
MLFLRGAAHRERGIPSGEIAMSSTPSEKRRAFRKLHESGCFVIPNPWDVGSALYLQSLGFPALASTSSGFAWSQGRADNTPTRAEILAHLAQLAAAIDVPLNADFENGFGADAAGVTESVRLAVETGIAGLSIEDSVGPRLMHSAGAVGTPPGPLFDVDTAVERIRAARRAIDATGEDVLLVGRAEGFLVGRPDIDEAVTRLIAYANAGADCLYAPGIQSPEHIRRVVEAVHPKPANVLVMAPAAQSVRQLAGLGVRRVSVGGALARAAWGGFMSAAREIAEQGRFDALANAASGRSLNALFDPQEA